MNEDRQRDERGRLLSTIVCGRKFCTGRCKLWRPIIDFGPQSWWDKEKTKIRSVQTRCYYCHRLDNRDYYASLTDVERRRRSEASRAWYRRDRRRKGLTERGARSLTAKQRGSVRREPLARFLREKILKFGLPYVVSKTKLGERQIWVILNGYDSSGGHNQASKKKGGKKRKLRQVDWVSFNLVDRTLLNWGDPGALNLLYPVSGDPDLTPPEPIELEPKTPELAQLIAEAKPVGAEGVPDVIGAYKQRRAVARASRRR